MARLNDQQGAIAVTVALVMAVMLAMTALALDVGHALVARNQLQNASDAAALAGARALGVIYGGMTGSLTGYTLSGGDAANIMNAATVAAVRQHGRRGDHHRERRRHCHWELECRDAGHSLPQRCSRERCG